MLKDLVDYFKLEEINIDNWTFKLYYKVICLQIGPVWRVSKNNGDTFCFEDAKSLPIYQYHTFAWISLCFLCQISVSLSVKCVKRVMSEKLCFGTITVDPRTTMSWINNNVYCSQLNFAQKKVANLRKKLFQVSVVICMAGATIGIASQYFGDPIRW